jgi:hypothetical protein
MLYQPCLSGEIKRFNYSLLSAVTSALVFRTTVVFRDILFHTGMFLRMSILTYNFPILINVVASEIIINLCCKLR